MPRGAKTRYAPLSLLTGFTHRAIGALRHCKVVRVSIPGAMGLTLMFARLSVTGYDRQTTSCTPVLLPLCLPIAMSTTKPAMSHLTQPKLSADDLKILAARADWLSKAKFEKINADNFELCVDDGLPGIWTLLKGMDLVQKV